MERYSILFWEGDVAGFLQHNCFEIRPFRWEDRCFTSLLLSHVPLHGLEWVPPRLIHGGTNLSVPVLGDRAEKGSPGCTEVVGAGPQSCEDCTQRRSPLRTQQDGGRPQARRRALIIRIPDSGPRELRGNELRFTFRAPHSGARRWTDIPPFALHPPADGRASRGPRWIKLP